MRIGWIGAGKVGFTLGKYLLLRLEEQKKAQHTEFADISVSGYFSMHETSARHAAEFTDTRYYSRIEDLLSASDIVLLTVPDAAIERVWEQIRLFPIQGKLICHCSGAMTSQIFSGVTEAGAFGYSIHPMYAISSKTESYKEMQQAFFTVEGHPQWAEAIRNFIVSLGNPCVVISAENKVRYHCSAVFASNLVTGLFVCAEELLSDCGFDKNQTRTALAPLFLGNADRVASDGPEDSLTGPVERNDVATVKKHLHILADNERRLYQAASLEILRVARCKHPNRDYSEMERLLHTGFEQTSE